MIDINTSRASRIILGIIAVLFICVLFFAILLPSPAVAPEESQILIEVGGEATNDEEFRDPEVL